MTNWQQWIFHSPPLYRQSKLSSSLSALNSDIFSFPQIFPSCPLPVWPLKRDVNLVGLIPKYEEEAAGVNIYIYVFCSGGDRMPTLPSEWSQPKRNLSKFFFFQWRKLGKETLQKQVPSYVNSTSSHPPIIFFTANCIVPYRNKHF